MRGGDWRPTVLKGEGASECGVTRERREGREEGRTSEGGYTGEGSRGDENVVRERKRADQRRLGLSWFEQSWHAVQISQSPDPLLRARPHAKPWRRVGFLHEGSRDLLFFPLALEQGQRVRCPAPESEAESFPAARHRRCSRSRASHLPQKNLQRSPKPPIVCSCETCDGFGGQTHLRS